MRSLKWKKVIAKIMFGNDNFFLIPNFDYELTSNEGVQKIIFFAK